MKGEVLPPKNTSPKSHFLKFLIFHLFTLTASLHIAPCKILLKGMSDSCPGVFEERCPGAVCLADKAPI